MPLNEVQERLCSDNRVDYSDLSAVLINTSLKKKSSVSRASVQTVGSDLSRRAGSEVQDLPELVFSSL